MDTPLESSHHKLPKLQAPPEWGVDPVPVAQRVLGFWDFFVLWGDLGIGLLVLLTGSFLVPGLSLSSALLAIVIGTILGCLLLSLVGRIGGDNGIPTMVLLRPVLGLRGSYLPSVLNALQLIGWTIFEFIIMGFAGDAICKALFGHSSLTAWIAIFALIVILMGLGGPIGVVRKWLKTIAVWVMLGTSVWLTYHLLTTYNIAAIMNQPGNGSLPFWVAVDLVIAMPISWLPMVADYNRFSQKTTPTFLGTFFGYFITNVWFYALGALVFLAVGLTQDPKGFVTSMALTAGWIALLILLVDETDNAWADLYSSAISVQNIFPKVSQRGLIIGLGVFSFLVAVVLDITRFENFLLLCGSLFIPLFGILLADYFIIHHQHYDLAALYPQNSAGQHWTRTNLWSMIAWVAGILIYNITNPVTLGAFIPGWVALVPTSLTVLGGSLPSFLIAFILYTLLAWAFPVKSRPAGVTKEISI